MPWSQPIQTPNIELPEDVKQKMLQDKVWPHWTDVLGQTYRPGDFVAVAVINGRSPQMVIGEVVKINSVNSKGEAITRKEYHHTIDEETGIRTTWNEEVISCTVRVRPILDARGFYRTGKKTKFGYGVDGPIKEVTYQFWENIIKVPKPPDD